MNKIGEVDIKELAENYGTPLYVYDKNKIIENYNKLKSAFITNYDKTKIHFSVKSNSNIHILRIFKELGAGADCSSPIEYKLARLAGFEDKNILYTGNYELPEDFNDVAFSDDSKINLDDITSFDRLKKVNIPKRISFRINPGVGRGGFEGITTGGTEAKFGIPYEKALDAYKLALDNGVERFGIHMMTGSNNLEPYFFAEIVDKLMMIAGDLFNKIGKIPEYVDIGGGFGIPYSNDEQELNIERTGQMVTEVFKEKCEKYGFGTPELVLEPGRYLTANAGYLISKVTAIKHSYKTFVGLDSGMNTLIRPALYGAIHRVEVYDKEENTQVVNLCGQICENSDIFAKNIPFPNVEEGDIAIFRDAGAYGYVMASNYNNRFRPAEILIDKNEVKVIRRRENFDDFMNLYENL